MDLDSTRFCKMDESHREYCIRVCVCETYKVGKCWRGRVIYGESRFTISNLMHVSENPDDSHVVSKGRLKGVIQTFIERFS